MAGAAATGLAFAHTGPMAHEHAATFAAGLAHPLTGLDHLLAALGVGLWMATSETRHGAARIGALFLAAITLGVLAGGALGTLSGVEPLLATSVVLLGTLVAAAFVVPPAIAAPLVAVAGVLHGFAHGSEAPAVGAPWLAGIVLSTLAVMLAGALLGRAIGQAWRPQRAMQWVGGAVACAGLSLFVL